MREGRTLDIVTNYVRFIRSFTDAVCYIFDVFHLILPSYLLGDLGRFKISRKGLRYIYKNI